MNDTRPTVYPLVGERFRTRGGDIAMCINDARAHTHLPVECPMVCVVERDGYAMVETYTDKGMYAIQISELDLVECIPAAKSTASEGNN